MKEDLKKFLFVDKLNEIDTEGVDPLIYLSDEKNVLRTDEISSFTSQRRRICLKIPLQKIRTTLKVSGNIKKINE